jgi:tetratricopeptide (TPR) repeat protein
VDILPTILDALDLEPPRGLSGRSLLPAAAGRPAEDRPLYFEALSAALTRGWAPLRGVVSGGWKFIDLPVPELYDLNRDPAERQNLFEGAPERARAMRDQLAGWVRLERPAPRIREDAEARERLRSLGYVTGSAAPKRSYSADDDPKSLIALDARLQEVVGLYVEGRLPEAVARCRELVASRPNMAISLLHLAHLERESGNLAEGIQALKRALALSPGSQETVALLAGYLTEAGRAAEATALLQPFIAREDADVQVLISGALALARSGRPDAALDQLDRAQALDPTSASTRLHAGTVLLMAGRTADARKAFEEALAVNPSLARAHSSLGAIAAERGERDAALAHWRAATTADPSEFRTVLAVAIGLARTGRPGAARPYFEFFVTSAPDERYARERAQARQWLASHVQ